MIMLLGGEEVFGKAHGAISCASNIGDVAEGTVGLLDASCYHRSGKARMQPLEINAQGQ